MFEKTITNRFKLSLKSAKACMYISPHEFLDDRLGGKGYPDIETPESFMSGQEFPPHPEFIIENIRRKL